MGIWSKLTSAPLTEKINTALLLLPEFENHGNGRRRRHDEKSWPTMAYAAYTAAGQDIKKVWVVFTKEDHAIWDSGGLEINPLFSGDERALLVKVIAFGNRVMDSGVELDGITRKVITDMALSLPKDQEVLSMDEFRRRMRVQGKENSVVR